MKSLLHLLLSLLDLRPALLLLLITFLGSLPCQRLLLSLLLYLSDYLLPLLVCLLVSPVLLPAYVDVVRFLLLGLLGVVVGGVEHVLLGGEFEVRPLEVLGTRLWLPVGDRDVHPEGRLQDTLDFSGQLGHHLVGVVPAEEGVDGGFVDGHVEEVVRDRAHVRAVHNLVGHFHAVLIPLPHLLDHHA